ncbi:MAG: hypothetical protein RQ833_06910 [Sphingomonadaceae bacterium]|nr:hypothetical protein [Sphingomonadaceae bacterium]
MPALGTASWENRVANGGTGNITLVAGTEDGANGRIQFYVGTKTSSANPIEAAGLTNGTRYFLQIGSGANAESRSGGLPGAGAINSGSLVKQSSSFTLTANASALTGFQRPEDFAWDPNNPSVGYFVTTDQFDSVKTGQGAQVGRSRLWRVRFTDIANPTAGGTIEMLLDDTEDLQMMDNIAVGEDGKVYIQEDPGNQRYNAHIFAYDPTTGTIAQAFQHDPRRFGTLGGFGSGALAPTAPFNQDEESSGIVEVTKLFRGSLLDAGGRNSFFLADVQAHYALG